MYFSISQASIKDLNDISRLFAEQNIQINIPHVNEIRQMALSPILDRPTLTVKAEGDAIFDNSRSKCKVKVDCFRNGNILGDVSFPQEYYVEFIKISLSPVPAKFLFDGTAEIDGELVKLNLENCFITGTSISSGNEKGFAVNEVAFIAFKLVLGNFDYKSLEGFEILFKYGIMNMWQTFRVTANTEIGVLSLHPYADIKESEKMMNLYRATVETFQKFQDALTDFAKSWLAQNKADSQTRAYFYRSFKGLNRRQYVGKAEQMITALGIRIDDLKITLPEIVKIRNDITHTGSFGKDKKAEDVITAYYAFKMILVRIFLALLDYQGSYQDKSLDRFVNFRDVRKQAS